MMSHEKVGKKAEQGDIPRPPHKVENTIKYKRPLSCCEAETCVVD